MSTHLNSPVRRASGAATFAALASIAHTAGTQTITTPLPGSATSPTAVIPNVACSPTTTRSYAAWTVNVATPGNHTFNVSKGAGAPGGLTLTVYQGLFLPSNACVNQWTPTVTSAGTSLSTTQLLSPAGTFVIVVGGAGASDTSNVAISASGPAALTSICTDSTLTPSSSTIAAAGGALSTVYEPTVGCASWTTTGVPAWISGFPASGTGRSTISEDAPFVRARSISESTGRGTAFRSGRSRCWRSQCRA